LAPSRHFSPSASSLSSPSIPSSLIDPLLLQLMDPPSWCLKLCPSLDELPQCHPSINGTTWLSLIPFSLTPSPHIYLPVSHQTKFWLPSFYFVSTKLFKDKFGKYLRILHLLFHSLLTGKSH
jgi:hypothetical protein